jgi:hypothetical protein
MNWLTTGLKTSCVPRSLGKLAAGALTLSALLAGVNVPSVGAVTKGPYFIKFAFTGKCFDVPNYSTANGTAIDEWTCVNQTNEQWYLDYVSSTTFRVRNRASGKCLNFSGASKALGTRIVQWTCGSYTNETFVNISVPYAGYSELLGTNGFGLVVLPYAWNGYGWVVNGANGTKLQEGDAIVDYRNDAGIWWCKSINNRDCSMNP